MGEYFRGGDGIDSFDRFTSTETIIASGGGGNDYLAGGSANDRLSGGTGDDELRGYAGADWLDGGAGADWMDGGEGRDTFVLRKGEIAGDYIDFFEGGGRNGDGDFLRFEGFSANATLSWTMIEATGRYSSTFRVTITDPGDPTNPNDDHVESFVLNSTHATPSGYLFSLKGTAQGGDDYVFTPTPRAVAPARYVQGTAEADVLDFGQAWGPVLVAAGGGDDVVTGSDHRDSLSGGAGDDVLDGGLGDDRLDGGAGADVLFANGPGRDTLVLRKGEIEGDEIRGYAEWGRLGGDILRFEGFSAGATVEWTYLRNLDRYTGVFEITVFDPADGSSETFTLTSLHGTPDGRGPFELKGAGAGGDDYVFA